MRLPRRSALAALVLAALGGGALAACSSPSSSSAGGASGISTTTIASSGGAPGGGKSAAGTPGEAALSSSVGKSVSPSAPLVVRTGTVTLGVGKAHIVQTFNLVSSAATSMGGFVASSSSNAADDRTGAQLVVRVPSSDFGTLVTRVDALGKVEGQSENGQDVTGESIDIQASLATCRARRARCEASCREPARSPPSCRCRISCSVSRARSSSSPLRKTRSSTRPPMPRSPFLCGPLPAPQRRSRSRGPRTPSCAPSSWPGTTPPSVSGRWRSRSAGPFPSSSSRLSPSWCGGSGAVSAAASPPLPSPHRPSEQQPSGGVERFGRNAGRQWQSLASRAMPSSMPWARTSMSAAVS